MQKITLILSSLILAIVGCASAPVELSSTDDTEATGRPEYIFFDLLEFDDFSRLIAFHRDYLYIYRPEESKMLVVDYRDRTLVDEVELQDFEPALSVPVDARVYFFEQHSTRDKASYLRSPRIAMYLPHELQLRFALLDEPLSPIDLTYAAKRESIFAIDAYTDAVVELPLYSLVFDDISFNPIKRQFIYEIRPGSIAHISPNVLLMSDRSSNNVTGFDDQGLRPVFDFYNVGRSPVSSLTVLLTTGDQYHQYVLGLDLSERDPVLLLFDLDRVRDGIVSFNDFRVLRGNRRFFNQARQGDFGIDFVQENELSLLPHDDGRSVVVHFSGSDQVSVLYPEWDPEVARASMIERTPIRLRFSTDRIVRNGLGCIAAGKTDRGLVAVYCLPGE